MNTRKNKSAEKIGVIDIFAGPGGLGEGFSTFKPKGSHGQTPFQLVVSAEMEITAHSTLQLRSFVRLLKEREGPMPPTYREYLKAYSEGKTDHPAVHFGTSPLKSLWNEATAEALNLTLGEESQNTILHERIRKVRRKFDRLVLIGGPPCQAYSVVGRARQRNVKGFQSKGTQKHYLYKQYLGILAEFSPHVFIMENVRGMLTSAVGGVSMFEAIKNDLVSPSAALGIPNGGTSAKSRYVLLPLHVEKGQLRTPESVEEDPSKFIVKCENHGIAQARHRVIIMGVREDLYSDAVHQIPGLDTGNVQPTAKEALSGLPRLRGGISKRPDDAEEWGEAVQRAAQFAAKAVAKSDPDVQEAIAKIKPATNLKRKSTTYAGESTGVAESLRVRGLETVLNHDTRGHKEEDMRRYIYVATHAKVHGRCPVSSDFPKVLAPDHKNWESGKFADRFRAQLPSKVSSTITSHLSKDGNAFIHWDAAHCRSLTVREAARLQSFPDDYLFLGCRTAQFVQVGNAVPPLIARQIAKLVYSIIGE